MSEEYTEIDRINANRSKEALSVHKISVYGQAEDALLGVAKRKGLERNDVAVASQVARCVAQMDSLMVGFAAGYNNDGGELSLTGDTVASNAFCNILGRDGYADILKKDFGVNDFFSERIDFEKELVSCINGNRDSMLIKMTNDGVLQDDKFARAENRSNLQNMYMDAKLLQACGREGDILSLMSEVRDYHDVHNIKLGTSPKSQEEFDAEFEQKVPMYKEAAEKLRADGKEINLSNLQLCVFDMERKKEAEQKAKEAKTDEPRKSSFMDKIKGLFKKKEKIDKSVLDNKAQETEDRKKDGGVSSKPTISKEQVLALQGRVDPTPKEPVKATGIENPLRGIVDRYREPR